MGQLQLLSRVEIVDNGVLVNDANITLNSIRALTNRKSPEILSAKAHLLSRFSAAREYLSIENTVNMY